MCFGECWTRCFCLKLYQQNQEGQSLQLNYYNPFSVTILIFVTKKYVNVLLLVGLVFGY